MSVLGDLGMPFAVAYVLAERHVLSMNNAAEPVDLGRDGSIVIVFRDDQHQNQDDSREHQAGHDPTDPVVGVPPEGRSIFDPLVLWDRRRGWYPNSGVGGGGTRTERGTLLEKVSSLPVDPE